MQDQKCVNEIWALCCAVYIQIIFNTTQLGLLIKNINDKILIKMISLFHIIQKSIMI